MPLNKKAIETEADTDLEAPPETEMDAAPDAGMNAPPEEGMDMPPEEEMDAPPEEGMDAPPEEGMDAPPEDEERETAITGGHNVSPIGDLKISKVKDTFNTYKLELSMGQIEVIMNALENNHGDVVSDELLAIFHYYVHALPAPGESEEEVKAREEGAAETGAQTLGDVEGEDVPIPMPPTEGEADTSETPPLPPGDPEDEEMLAEPPAPEGGPEGAPPEEEEELPPPPRE